MMTYFFLFAGTLLASQVIVERFSVVAQSLQRNPITFLMMSFVLLWFPVETIMSFSYMRSIGRYINTVLAPKLTALSEAEEGQTRHGEAFRKWQEDHFEPHLRGQLRWEAYLQTDRPYAYPYFGLSVFAMMRISILLAPSIIAGAQYVLVRLRSDLPPLPLLAIEVALLAAILFIIVAAFIRTIGSH